MSFSPIIRVRKLLDKMKIEGSPRLKRFPSRTSSCDLAERPRVDTSMDLQPMKKDSKTEVKTFGPSDNIYHFGYLPPEATLQIFSYLESDDLRVTCMVSKEWNSFANDELIWKNLVVNDMNVSQLLETTWKKTYHRLEKLFSDGYWEGMSKWIEPSGYDNEQKTTCKLQFLKKNRSAQSSPLRSPSLSKQVTRASSIGGTVNSELAKPARSIPYKIVGSGITINCSSPSPFKIEGERVASDSTGTTFEWNKQFEQHTSVYKGTLDLESNTVNGTINYDDGTTHWKGVFTYTKRKGGNTKSNYQVA